MKQRIYQYKNFKISATDLATLCEQLILERHGLYKRQFIVKGIEHRIIRERITKLTSQIDAAKQLLDLSKVA